MAGREEGVELSTMGVNEEGKALLENLAPKTEEQRQAEAAAAAAIAPPEASEETSAVPCGRRIILSYGLRFLVFLLILLVIALFATGGGRPSASSANVQYGWGYARAQTKLNKPVVILISSDGFRWGYNWKVDTPSIDRLRLNGTEAESGLIPVYPSLTFPNHYSIATGLYPAWHGIIANSFSDPVDPLAEKFYQGNLNPKWWLGEPIWVTVTKNALQAATFFWPGSEVVKDPWDCPKKFCMPYNQSVPYEERVDTVLEYFDLPIEEIPSYMSLYFESPDEEGHKVGPDDEEISQAVTEIDSLIGKLISGLDKKGVFEDVNIILLGDHGMVANCDSKVIYLEDLKPWVEIDSQWIDAAGALFALRPSHDVDVYDLYSKLKEGLASGKVENSENLKLYLKEEIPDKFLFSSSDRVWPILGIPAEGYKVEYERMDTSECGGQHGYDNSLLSMRTVFIAHGPEFARGRKVPSFINVELYNVMTSILGLKVSASNNGSSEFASSVLLPQWK